jgi:hypothetical protein
MEAILWHRRETRRQTANTNRLLRGGRTAAEKHGEQNGAEGRGVGRWRREVSMDAAHNSAVPPVPVTAQQGTETQDPQTWTWVEASIWTKRMLAALGNGVTGGTWYSLMDKVYAPRALEAAWKRVAANKGAAGVDGISITRFKARASQYLGEVEKALREGSYHPLPARRVHIPKGPGKPRPLGIAAVKDRIV